jgi:hypothetical protein
MATVSKLFRKPEDADKAAAELKGMGGNVSIIEKGAEGDLSSIGLSEQALDYYKHGLAIGGKVVKADVDDAKADEANKLLIDTGFNKLTERPAQWATSPSYVQAERMSATNPMDSEMTGDFRVY